MLTIEERSTEQGEILGLLTIIFLSKIDISSSILDSPNILQIHCFELNITLYNLYYVV